MAATRRTAQRAASKADAVPGATGREQSAAEWVSIDALKPWPKNPRVNARTVDAVAKSIQRFGWGAPIVARRENGEVVAGHTRLLAARKLGEERVPVRYVDLTEQEAHALALADNQIASLSSFDDDGLTEVLRELRDEEVVLDGLGWDDDELRKLLDDEPPPEPPMPSVPSEPVSKRGEVYELGAHRILCGDATNAEDVARLLDGARPFLMVTDPPYGVEYDPQWRVEASKAGYDGFCAGERLRCGDVPNDDRSDWSAAWRLFPGDVVYQWAPAGPTHCEHHAALAAAGFEVRMELIWSKSHFPISRGAYHVRHEPCLYAVRRGKTAHWCGGRDQTTVWEATLDPNVGGEDGGHATQKPVELMARPMRNHEAPEVYDPFLGSGTTLIAAARLGRRCYGMEISPNYCDVVVRRRWTAWALAAGQEPGPGALGPTAEP